MMWQRSFCHKKLTTNCEIKQSCRSNFTGNSVTSNGVSYNSRINLESIQKWNRLLLYPANIRLDEEVLKTSWKGVSSSSSEDVFKRSSRQLDQEEYIHLCHTFSEDILLNTNIFALVITSSRRLQDVLPRHLQNVFKTPCSRAIYSSWS